MFLFSLDDPQLVLMFVTKNPESSSEGHPRIHLEGGDSIVRRNRKCIREQGTAANVQVRDSTGEPRIWVWSMGFGMQDEVRHPGRGQIQDSLEPQVKSKRGLCLAGSGDRMTCFNGRCDLVRSVSWKAHPAATGKPD